MKLDQLTFTRYIAALTVVFFHFGRDVFPANITWLNPLVTAGPIAVCYFFVLSGFIMAVAYYNPDSTKPLNKVKYWLARLARIYPVYLLALLFMVADSVRKHEFDALAALLNLTMLQSWIPSYPLTYNSPGWSLSVEAFFYLTFPLWLVLAQKRHFKFLVIFSVAFWLGTQLFQIGLLNNWINASLGLPNYEARAFLQSLDKSPALHDFIFYNPLMHLSTFVLGFVVGVYFCRGRFTNRLSKTDNTLLMVVSALLAALLILTQASIEQSLGFKFALNNGLIAPLFMAFILFLALDQTAISRILTWPVLVLLGEASYSLYILQRPAYGIYKQATASWLPEGSNLHFYVFILVLTLGSILSYRYFETPVRSWINGLYGSSGKTS